MKNTKLLEEQEADKLLFQAEEIKRILISSLNTAKNNVYWFKYFIILISSTCTSSPRGKVI